MKRPKLIIADVDGTIINRRHRFISDYSRGIIQKMQDYDICFSPASGRPLDEVSILAGKWGFDRNFDMLAGMNGAEIWDGLESAIHSYYKLEPKYLREAIEIMAPYDPEVTMYYHGGILCRGESWQTSQSAFRSGKKLYFTKDDSDFWSEPNFKIMFRVAEDKMPEVEEYVRQHQTEHYHFFKTQKFLMEVSDARINKAVAMDYFCEHHGITREEVIAFGDTTNDNELIAGAGTGVCLLNGSDDTKALADYVTEYDVDHDGMFRWIEEYVFKGIESGDLK